MAIIHRAISTDIVHRAGFSKAQAKTGAVTYIQRFGSALNLNIHFHMLFLEGAIRQDNACFTRLKAPTHTTLVRLVRSISHRIARYLHTVSNGAKAGISVGANATSRSSVVGILMHC